ncbi:misfolded glycoproteins degradation protein [Moniliophthora roreri]|nr:misfolded glycoproteins degradation protein [Moniliophthora roreri]
MIPLSLLLLLLQAFLRPLSARTILSLPEDTYAFPKYKVAFLNNLPVLNETAHRWITEGLQGGEAEFLEQSWDMDSSESIPNLKEIDSGESVSPTAPKSKATSYSLEHMRMGPRDSYLCYIPAPLDLPPPSSEENEHTQPDEVTTAHSWSLLQELSGICLYAGSLTHIVTTAKYVNSKNLLKVTHTSQWESYTLGKAPVTPQPGADLTVAERNAIATNLELARGAGSRYLVQRWGDGTLCDKTGKPREVEVQFHCSMVMSDNILFVKEAKTCSYVLVINTPRLCGEPGFRSRREIADQALIKCREIIASADAKQGLFTVPDNDYPQKIPRPKLNLPSSTTVSRGLGQDKQLNDLIQKALASIKGQGFQDTSFIIEVVDEDDDEFAIGVELDDDITEADVDRISKALKAAGIDVRGPRTSSNDRQSADKKTGSGSEQSSSSRNSKRGPPSVRDDVGADDEGNIGLDRHRDEL